MQARRNEKLIADHEVTAIFKSVDNDITSLVQPVSLGKNWRELAIDFALRKR